MKKSHYLFKALFIGSIAFFAVSLAHFAHSKRAARNDTIDTAALMDLMPIVIDPGHGGGDPGKVGAGSKEAEINLAIARKLERHLALRGFYVVMTRRGPEGLKEPGANWVKKTDMSMRKEIITGSKALVAISIHQNAHHDSSNKGPQVFYSDCLPENAILAQIIQYKATDASAWTRRRVIVLDNELMVLKGNEMPSALIECGFLTNRAEEELLVTDGYQEKIAVSIYEGICEFLAIAP
ncbi:MAG: N-acetylmuramoyl-L-alanine amidase [Eubacteriaceae bacterium]|nr:N-acetylmuramoyl-L-alanine amidase [Eubacteriaceae bacterium]